MSLLLSDYRRRLSADQVDELVRLARRGVDYRQVAKRVSCALSTVYALVGPSAGSREQRRSPAHLRLAEREEIRAGIERGESLRAIARSLNRNVSCVSREVKRNGGRAAYRAWRADERAAQAAKRPREAKISAKPELRRAIEAKLKKRWSPQQISQHLKSRYPHDESMQASHETIYQSLFVQTRGALRKELTAYLRTKRQSRKPRGRVETRGKLTNLINIRERPAEAEDRAVPGHWEGDLILGARQHSQIGTLVERKTRFVMLLALSEGRSTELVVHALSERVLSLPDALRRTLTWDQGKELAAHQRFTIKTGVPVYFCDPHSPWQRGSNENTNGLLRRYFPHGIDFSTINQTRLQEVEASQNRRHPQDARLEITRRRLCCHCCDDGLEPPSKKQTGIDIASTSCLEWVGRTSTKPSIGSLCKSALRTCFDPTKLAFSFAASSPAIMEHGPTQRTPTELQRDPVGCFVAMCVTSCGVA